MACEGVRARKGLRWTAFLKVLSFFFPLHQSCPNDIKGRISLSIIGTNQPHRHAIICPDIVCSRIRNHSAMLTWTAVKAGNLMCHALNIQALSSQIPGRLLSWILQLNIIDIIHFCSPFMRRLEQPQVLIQPASYLQRCRSHSVVPVIASPRCAGRCFRPLWLPPHSRLFHSLTIRIV